MKKHRISSAGFTLIEAAIVVVIGGIIMTAAAALLNNYLQASRVALTQSRMQDIDNALIQYLSVNGVLPCPAKFTDAPDTPNFGMQIADGHTTYCYASSGAGTFKTAGGRGNGAVAPATPGGIVIGSVPVRTLNLPDQEMADAWGNRFIYAVTDRLTVTNQYDPAEGSISVVDSNNGNVAVPAGSAQYVIVSSGEDRAGAYTIAGVAGGNACPAGGLETMNCTYPTTTFRKTILNSTQSGTGFYDDYVTFHTQVNSAGVMPFGTGMIAPFGLAACPSGWADYGPGGCSPAGVKCCQKK